MLCFDSVYEALITNSQPLRALNSTCRVMLVEVEPRELSYSNVMKQSITLTLGMYWEKRLSAAHRRFTRSCETLARVRKLSRNTPALQFNIATSDGQQVNLTK